MKIKTSVKDRVTGRIFQTEYDDVTKRHTVLDQTGEIITDLCSPINESITINGRDYTLQTDPHTGRKIGAFTVQRPFDLREFTSDQDYQDFLAGK
jgi:CII-binding regulator of phage lambda lysogenization HflD